MIIIYSSCTSEKEKRINTAYKVLNYLNEGKSTELQNLILLDYDKIDKEINRIEFDSQNFQLYLKKYGVPEKNKIEYSENPNDLIYPYKVKIPIFSGEDTLRNWKVHEISLLVYFGPEKFNSSEKISNYEIYIQKDILYWIK